MGLKFQVSGITRGTVDTMGKNFTSITGDNNLVVSDYSNSELIFSKQQEYRCILINFAPDYIVSNLNDLESPVADRIMAMFEGIRTDFLLRSFDRFDYQAIQVLHDLTTCPFIDGVKELYFEVKVLQLLNHQLSRLHDKKEPDSMRGTASELKKVKDLGHYLRENPGLPYSIAGLAALSEMNAHKLKTLFKKVYNMSVFEYQHLLRLDQARELLERGDKTIGEISHLLGYSQPSHFIHAFKKKFGCTPANFRSHDQSVCTIQG